MNATPEPDRCRLVIIAPAEIGGTTLVQACEGGDVASVVLPRWDRQTEAFQAFCEEVAPALQSRGIAVLVEGDSRVAGRVGADGIHVEGPAGEVAEAVARAQGRSMVGANGGRTRHEALEIGEARPDYVFFGRFGYDREPEPHPRNLSLGQWWAEMVELPCIVQAGSALSSVAAVAATGADFVAVSAALFDAGADPREAVARINRLLDDEAPRFRNGP
ncbi:MAG: thiamine phosphate synthase [Rhizobiaceae bacterium]|nr:thiamine phosphate synthase [Rhizobiaceae bacterium]MCV0407321.1 thiamine phosphate synthase [Rhizobiaceae bacterium]